MDKIEKIRQEIERLKGICTAQIKANPEQTFPFVMEMTGYDKLLSFIDTLSKEPDKSLEEAAEEYSRGLDYYHYTEDDPAIAFIAGAKWMQDQFEKNRLANCDKLTKEEYDRETDFAAEIIEKEHRQPTFTDAINYGMRVMKDQMMKEAVEGTIICYNDETYSIESCCFDNKEHHHHSGDKVKLIVIKEDEK